MKGIYRALVLSVSAAVLLQVLSVEAGVINSGNEGNKTHNYFYGTKSYLDRILYHDLIKYKSKWMRVVSVDVDYPANRTTPLGKISYIEVLDQRSDGTGGYVYIKNGGVGSNFVTLHVKTQRNHGMDFVVNVYGR